MKAFPPIICRLECDLCFQKHFLHGGPPPRGANHAAGLFPTLPIWQIAEDAARSRGIRGVEASIRRLGYMSAYRMNSTREETTTVPDLAARHMPDNNRCQPGTKVRGKGKGMAELAKWSNAARGSAKNRSFFLLAASLIRREVGCGPSLVQRLRPCLVPARSQVDGSHRLVSKASGCVWMRTWRPSQGEYVRQRSHKAD